MSDQNPAPFPGSQSSRQAAPQNNADGKSHQTADQRKQRSIVPGSSVAGTSLILVIGIMAFLASLTLGAVLIVNDTARGWQNEISLEATVQVRESEGADLDKAVEKAAEISRTFPGIESISIIDDNAMGRLLEPWLGNGANLKELPVPRLIILRLDTDNPPDLSGLKTQISSKVPGGSLDDHSAWVGRLTTMAQTIITVGIFVFLLMMVTTILNVIFATRGAMSGNRHVIEVLHFVGADQSYIAKQFQKHFLLLGLKGSLAGGLSAILLFIIVGFWTNNTIADPSTEQVQALFGRFSMSLTGYLGILLLIVALAALTALTSRFTVLKHVDGLDRSIKEY